MPIFKVRGLSIFNPVQTPVMIADQPLYVFLKKIQCKWQICCGLNIEMACFKILGEPLRNSGWIEGFGMSEGNALKLG